MAVETHHAKRSLGIVLILGALMLVPGEPNSAAAQQAARRFAVWVPDFEAEDRAARDVGRDVARRLQTLIDDLGTHRSVSEQAVEDALDLLRVDEDDLDCERARGVAGQAEVAVLVCGTVASSSRDGAFDITARFVTVETGETFDVPLITVSKDATEGAATDVFDTFQTLVEQQRRAQFCAEFALSEQWERALENCDAAIALNPSGTSSLYTRGMVRVRLEQWRDALADFRQVLDRDAAHANALKAAGLASTHLGESARALEYYQSFLQLNPEDVHVRMNLAYETATAGDPHSAMILVDEGLAIDPEQADLLLQKAGYAMSAAERRFRENENALTDEAARLYRESIDAYETVLTLRPDEAKVSHRRNVISAHQRLDDLAMALETAESALLRWPEEAQLWSVQADVLKALDRTEDALLALARAHELDPTYPNVLVRKGTWLLEAGRDDEAVTTLGEAVERGERPSDDIANVLFVSGYRDGVGPEIWSKAVSRFRHALRFAEGDEVRTKVSFWLGYGLLKQGQALEGPQTLDTARLTRPIFEEALRLLRGSAGYSEIEAAQLQNLIDGAGRFLEIQDAIIRRGGR